MALIEPFMIKTALDLGADKSVELTAKTGESLLIKDIWVYGSDDEYCLLEIDKTTVGFFRIDNHILQTHLGTPCYISGKFLTDRGALVGGSLTLISYMIRKGWMRGYPVAEGQTFRIKPYTSGKGLGNVMIIYEKYDAGDIKATDPNGSEAKEYVFVNYGRPSSALTQSKDYVINNCMTTEEFPDFPFGEAVPAKTTIDILAILGSETIDYVDASNYVQTKYLKLFKGRTCLFDRDKHGLLFYGVLFSGITVKTHVGRGFSVIGGYTTLDRREPFVLPKPITFEAGSEVKMFVTANAVGSTASIEQKYVEIGVVEKVSIAE